MNLEAQPGKLQPGTSQPGYAQHSQQEHCIQRIPHYPGDQLQLRSVGAAPHNQASNCGSSNLLTESVTLSGKWVFTEEIELNEGERAFL